MREDVAAFLRAYQLEQTLAHVKAVASEATLLALRFNVNPDQAEQAGLVHDISAVIPADQRLEAARKWGLSILPEEEACPMLLHQRLSSILARQVLGIRDEDVLSAAGCHTTLRPRSTPLDRVVFIADKLAWDQPGMPPYLEDLRVALDASLEQGAWFYLNYLRTRATGPLHPWARQAWQELSGSTHLAN